MVSSCPDPAALEALALGRLPETARQQLEEHLDECADCRHLVAEVARLYGSASVGPRTANQAWPQVSVATAPLGLARTERATDSPSSSNYHSEPPSISVNLGRYHLGRQLGAGAMGVVFEAHDPELDRPVAVKLLHPDPRQAASTVRTRLLREARAMARLAHPNVVTVFDVGHMGEQVFVAMELVSGTTLTHWLKTEPRSQAHILAIFAQAGRGLEAAHAVGLVHRDFKPDNVLIGADGRARVTDFGLARPVASAELSASSGQPSSLFTSLPQTVAGTLVGTPAYMAPEQLRGDAADARSDQFAFCVALYEALFNRPPYGGESIAELADNVIAGRLQPLSATAPRWLRDLLLRGLATDPAARFNSMSELLAELARDRGRKRRLALLLSAMAGGVLLLVGTFYAIVVTVSAANTDPPTLPAAARKLTCDQQRSELRDRWNDQRRNAVTSRLSKATLMHDGKDLAPRVSRALDRWAEQWDKERVKLCQAGQDAPLAGDRLSCLQSRLQRFDTLVREIAHGDDTAVGYALSAVDSLPAATDCGNDTRVRAIVQAPAASKLDASTRIQAEQLQDKLATAEAKLSLGSFKLAQQIATEVITEAKQVGDTAALAHGLLVKGLVAKGKGQLDGAVKSLTAAAATAKSARHEEVLGRAALELVDLVGARQLRPADAEPWIRIVRADAQRFGDQRLEAALEAKIGAVQQAQAEYRDAHKSITKALKLQRGLYGNEHSSVAATLEQLAGVELDLERADQSLKLGREALGIWQQVAGKNGLRSAQAQTVIGRALLALRKPTEALKHHKRAADIRQRKQPLWYGLDTAISLDDKGLVLQQLGRFDEARKAFDDATKKRNGFPDFSVPLPELWISLSNKGDLLLAEGKTDQAVANHRQAVELLEQRYGMTDPRLVAPLRRLGLAQAAVGQPAAGVKTLRRALKLTLKKLPRTTLIGLIDSELGRVELQAKQPRKALKHFDDAYVSLVGGFDVYHRRIEQNVLIRADLAYELGQQDYAGRLYRSAARALLKRHGPDHPDTKRATERAAPEPDAGAPASQSNQSKIDASTVRKLIKKRIKELQTQ